MNGAKPQTVSLMDRGSGDDRHRMRTVYSEILTKKKTLLAHLPDLSRQALPVISSSNLWRSFDTEHNFAMESRASTLLAPSRGNRI